MKKKRLTILAVDVEGGGKTAMPIMVMDLTIYNMVLPEERFV